MFSDDAGMSHGADADLAVLSVSHTEHLRLGLAARPIEHVVEAEAAAVEAVGIGVAVG